MVGAILCGYKAQAGRKPSGFQRLATQVVRAKNAQSSGRSAMTANTNVKALDRGKTPLFEPFLVFPVISGAISCL